MVIILPKWRDMKINVSALFSKSNIIFSVSFVNINVLE